MIFFFSRQIGLSSSGDAIPLLAGSRITGRFELSADVKEEIQRILDTKLSEDEVILSRRLTRQGRSHAYVNDVPVAIGTLKQIVGRLVDIHGQRETESLLDSA